MLKLIDPRLNADVLHALALMGHGDVVVVAYANFPAAANAAHTPYGRLLRLDNLTLGESIEAILSLLPVDLLVDDAACRMRVDGKPDELPPVQQEAQRAIDALGETGHTLAGLERQRFYERAKQAYVVILTGERRFYGTVLLRKGVIDPPA